MKMGEKIKNLRKDKGFTQEEFAKIIGISRFSLINYERGARSIPEEVIKKISTTFKIELKEDFISFKEKDYSLSYVNTTNTLSSKEGAPENMRLESFKNFLTLSGYSVETLTFKELLTLHNKTREYIEFQLFKQGNLKSKHSK